MKKKILFVCFIFLTLYYTFAQNLDFKYFSDYSKDFSAVEIKDFLRRYISEKEAKDFRNTNNEDQLEEEIKNGINEKILSSGRIRDVVFQQKDVIE